ncbi:MAG TPA: hypothetical protein VGV89_07260 [Thermoplasmata archaeon]|nr:hypothetical protein [Thermoplasmata archaeon]
MNGQGHLFGQLDVFDCIAETPIKPSKVGAAAGRTIARRGAVYARYLAIGAHRSLCLQIAYEAQIRIRTLAHIMPRGRYNDGFNDYLNAAAMRAVTRGES